MEGEATVYLIHFETPFKHAQHYIGWTSNLTRRIRCHRKGTGARLLRAVNAEGIPWEVVRTWPGSQKLERSKKTHARRACPVCREQAKERDFVPTL